MVIVAGPPDAISFNDDTSPNTTNTKKRNVSIVGQVRRERPLDWYYDLISLWGASAGEPKSDKIIEIYKNLDRKRREKIWETLKEIQINITDPLPYQARFEKTLQQILNRTDAAEHLRQRANAKDRIAKDFLDHIHDFTAESILRDAPSANLSWLLQYKRNSLGYGFSKYMDIGYRPPPRQPDLSRFKSAKKGSIVRTVTEWTAKSASVFSDAIDTVASIGFYFHDDYRVYKALQPSHAFDKGNKKLIDLLEDERREIAKQFSYHAFSIGMHPLSPLRGDVDSKESYYVQAADIAAGFASHLYEQGGILAVTLHFEYVMFNGKRISQDEADVEMKKWKQLGYI